MKALSIKFDDADIEALDKIAEIYREEEKFYPTISDLVRIAVRTFIEEKLQ